MTPLFLSRCLLLATGSALAGLALAGCGGVSGNTDAARIRTIDVAVNAETANILVNGASANGDQQAFTDTAVSPYLYVAGNQKSSFLFTTTVTTIPTTLILPAGPILTLNNNEFYTAFLVGRSDAYTGIKADSRFLRVVVTSDAHTGPAAGNASVRIVDAAPDAGTVDVKVNGAALSATYTGLTYQTPTQVFLTAPYIDVPAGNVSVLINKSGTATALFPAASVAVTAGKSYTFVITEPAVTPTYGLQVIPD